MNKEEKTELIKSMAKLIIIKKEKALIQWKKPYSFILDPDIIKHKEIVRTIPVKHAQSDDLRTVVYKKSALVQMWFGKIA